MSLSDFADESRRPFEIDSGDLIVLQVGDSTFKTTVATLKKIENSYFSALLSGQYPLCKQEDGSIFIDRDGKHFASILSFLRSGFLPCPTNRIERKELLLEAEYYCLKEHILNSWARFFKTRNNKSKQKHSINLTVSFLNKNNQIEDEEFDKQQENGCVWESNIVFVGSLDDNTSKIVRDSLSTIQCPNTTEHVWKSIQEDGLTVIFQICHPSSVTGQNSDFSLKNIGELLGHLKHWKRPKLRFALVYDAELIRELLKISGEKFNNTGQVMYFSRGKLIESTLQWKLKYVAENIWKHYYISIH